MYDNHIYVYLECTIENITVAMKKIIVIIRFGSTFVIKIIMFIFRKLKKETLRLKIILKIKNVLAKKLNYKVLHEMNRTICQSKVVFNCAMSIIVCINYNLKYKQNISSKTAKT